MQYRIKTKEYLAKLEIEGSIKPSELPRILSYIKLEFQQFLVESTIRYLASLDQVLGKFSSGTWQHLIRYLATLPNTIQLKEFMINMYMYIARWSG